MSESQPLADDPVEVEVLSSERVFDGAVWDVRRERFLLDGTEIVRDFVAHTGAVAVLAMDDEGRVLLIKQYRHPIRARDWELPAGLLDIADEPPLEAARRELAEEVDLVADNWAVLSDFWTTPGGSSEVLRVYLARGLSAAPEVHARTEEEAGIELRWVSLDDAVDAVLERRMQNAITSIALLAAQAGRARGWSTLAPADAPWPWHPLNRGI